MREGLAAGREGMMSREGWPHVHAWTHTHTHTHTCTSPCSLIYTNMPYLCSFTHSLTHSLARSLTYSLAHSLNVKGVAGAGNEAAVAARGCQHVCRDAVAM